jgi:hypothetical protein
VEILQPVFNRKHLLSLALKEISMNASDQGNKQSIYGGNSGASRSDSQGYADVEHDADMAIDGYGEVRRLDRSQGSRQSASGQDDGARQGGAQSAS